MLGGLAVAAGLSLSSSSIQAGQIDYDLYGDFGITGVPIPGTFVEDLTGATSYPDSPALTSRVEQGGSLPPLMESLAYPEPFEKVDAAGDSYGMRVQGYLEVPETGDWKFFISSDDGSQLELSTDHTPGNAEVVANVPGDACCDPFMDDGIRSSNPISLEQGQQYYFQVLMKEGAGNDWFEVGWTGPGVEEPTRIGAEHLQRLVPSGTAPAIVAQPSDVSLAEEDVATTPAVFSVSVDASPSVSYQWLENGSAIDGAISSSYSFTASVDDSGNTYSVEISNDQGTVTSEAATLTVTPDTTAPELVQANHRGNPNGIRLRFSEPVDEASATNVDNYTLDGGDLEVTSAELLENGFGVQLGGDFNFQLESTHTIEVADVIDRAASPNTIAPNPSSGNITFVGGQGVTYDLNNGLPDNLQIYGNAEVRDSGSHDGSGFLSVNDGAEAQLGAALFTDRLDIDQVQFNFKMRVADTSDNPADGFSFNVADDLPEGTYPQSEEGYNATTDAVNGQGLMVAFDNYNSGAGDDSPSVTVKFAGEVKGNQPLPGGGTGDPVVEEIDGRELPSIHRGDRWFDVEIDVRPDGSLFMTYDGYTIFEGLQTDFDGIQNAQIGFGGRTGNAWESHWVDDLNVNFQGGEVGPIAIAEGEQPQDQLDVAEHEQVTFDVITTGSVFGLAYQWMKDGEPIEGATGRSLTLTAAPSAAGEYSVQVQNEFSETMSEAATLSVVPDTEPAMVANIHNAATLRDLYVLLSEPVTQESAENLDNYSFDGPAVQSAALQDDPTVVLLTLEEPLADATDYTLTVGGLVDRSEAGNAMPSSETSLTSWRSREGVRWEAYTGITGTAVVGMTDADKYPFSPDETRRLASFDMGGTGNFFGDNYGARMTALFHPPESGDYRFFVRSDDSSELFLGADGTIGSIGDSPIAEETACCNPFQAVGAAQTSDVISLTEGEPVVLQYLMKEGGGGDWAQVAYRMEGDTTSPADLSPIPAEELTTAEPDLSSEGAPMVTDVLGMPSLTAVEITFSEPLTQSSAGAMGNYSIDGLSIESASVNIEGTTVTLTTGMQELGTSYAITLNGLTDLNGEEIAADTTVTFSAPRNGPGVLWEAYTGISGVAVGDLTGAGSYPDSPDEVRVLNGFDMGGSGSFLGDNYGARMTSTFTPPETGDYRFFVRSDDASQLFLSQDGTEEGLQLIAEETGCCNAFLEPGNPQTSDVVSLTQGEPVLLQMLMKEGGGGDWAQMAYRLESDTTAPADLTPLSGDALSTVQPAPFNPEFVSTSPADGAVAVPSDTGVSFVLQDGGSPVDDGTIEVTVDGDPVEISASDNSTFPQMTEVDVTSELSLSSFSTIDVTVSFQDAAGTEHSLSWSFNTALDVAGTFVEGTRFIEAEDYNHENGQWIEDANGGATGQPYSGGAYSGLEGVNGIDFNDGGGGGGEPAYRFDVATDQPGPATVAFEEPDDLDRGTFQVESNWKVGWTAEGEWSNFTRDFPSEETTYDVYARISSGGTDPNPILGRVTSDPTQEDQTVEDLGQFTGAASGDWGTAIFYKMHAVGEPETPAQVTLSGENTIRLTVGSGNMDWDYLAFVPAEPIGGGTLGISFSEGTVTITWDDGSTLQSAPAVSGPWTDVEQGSPATFSVEDSTEMYFRTAQ